MVHRRRRRYRRRYRRVPGGGGFAAVAVGAAIGLAALAGHLPPGTPPSGAAAAAASSAPGKAAATAIGFARQQLGQPYLWGGTGPGGFDCSGLVMMAYQQAGIHLERTSQDQWASEPHVPAGQEEPGDLVFFAGGDGTPTSPGHVGLVTGHDLMIEAYATGYPVRYSQFGTASSPPGDQDPVGFTQPWGAGR
jgi:peptidoglycan DL-endopeptidase CwlO